MTLALIICSVCVVILALLLTAAMWEIDRLTTRAAQERRELEDRFMSVTQPLALTHVDAVRRAETEVNIDYVDERRELELQQEE